MSAHSDQSAHVNTLRTCEARRRVAQRSGSSTSGSRNSFQGSDGNAVRRRRAPWPSAVPRRVLIEAVHPHRSGHRREQTAASMTCERINHCFQGRLAWTPGVNVWLLVLWSLEARA